MKVVNISYPTPLSQIDDIENSNIDVFVELEDGNHYTVVVSTPKNYYWYMEKEGKGYYCGAPDIIVDKITNERIEEAITAYAEDGAYWLKYYHIAGTLSLERINQLVEEE